jgi:hypothetical protein|tara:strand:+ start:312 stop:668 length:357 start_codon:yes stop_codon:yes gene_type:complete
MAGSIEIDIAGLEGNMAAEPRRFAHSANLITIASGLGKADVAQDVLPTPATDEVAVLQRGACLYIGGTGNVKVLLEGDKTPVTFVAVPTGTFMPILVKKIYGKEDAQGTTATGILAYY